MDTYLAEMQYYDDSTFDGMWVGVERLFVCDSVEKIAEWASDLGWQVFSIVKVDPKNHVGLRIVRISAE